MQMQWKILQPDRTLVREIQQRLQCHPITATVLANRQIGSIDEAQHFIQPGLDKLPAPATLKGLERAVERIVHAIRAKERILVFGDYDADGITATSVLYNFLLSAGADVFYHLPHRAQEGYGLKPVHITQLAVPKRASLIITVDCGSSSFEAVATANKFNIDVIITDHHNLDKNLPLAFTILNPKMEGQPDALFDLAGVGVAFYLIIALRSALRSIGWWNGRGEPNLKAYCDLVAIGTVADMVSLKGVNRVLTRTGLDQICNAPRPGIQALLAASGIQHHCISSEDIAFKLAPRVNAAGRMAHAQLAFDLLNSIDEESANTLAQDLNLLNRHRQETENRIYQYIVDNLDRRPDFLSRKTIVLAGTDWHQGVLGVVAAKLVARYHRPAIVLSASDDGAKGSGRSVPQLDMYAAVERCAHLLQTFGGHRMAAGLSLRTENIGQFQTAFENAVTEMSGSPMIPELEIDCEIDLDQINGQLIDELENLSPFGMDNPQPLFMARDVRVMKAAIVGQHHRRMQVCQPHQVAMPMTAMQFNIPPDAPRPGTFERLAFHLQWNRYRSKKEAQLVVEAW
ncbi:MAG: single-stranded-DNA-specific exonuclease RecJ [Desulfobacteraceae bacterium]|nr:single-stranded-DNA-specific exonuclease RecJ [Desulfobacteraceae bacterium]